MTAWRHVGRQPAYLNTHVNTQRSLPSVCSVDERIKEIAVFSGPSTYYAKQRSAVAGIC